jgi:ubiquinone/menaquinone biosynthesis C-methylase UbiE
MIESWLSRAYAWACERLYHELAWGYDWIAALVSLGAWGQWRRLVLDDAPAGWLLELGPGTGALMVDAARRGWIVVGVERSPQMVGVAARRLGRTACHAHLIHGDAHTLPLADCCADSVIATFPAPYVLAETTLNEVARVLKPGGRLLIGGAWVRPNSLRLQNLGIFYSGAPDALLARLEERMAARGLRLAWDERRSGWAHVGVVVAEKPNA